MFLFTAFVLEFANGGSHSFFFLALFNYLCFLLDICYLLSGENMSNIIFISGTTQLAKLLFSLFSLKLFVTMQALVDKMLYERVVIIIGYDHI